MEKDFTFYFINYFEKGSKYFQKVYFIVFQSQKTSKNSDNH